MADDAIYGDDGNDSLFGAASDDLLYCSGADWAYGGDGQDAIHGEAGSDFLDGQGYGDTYYDVLDGYADTIVTGSGQDTIVGDTDVNDVLW